MKINKKREIKHHQKALQETLDLAHGKTPDRIQLSDAAKRLASSLHKKSNIKPMNIKPSSSRQSSSKQTPILFKK